MRAKPGGVRIMKTRLRLPNTIRRQFSPHATEAPGRAGGSPPACLKTKGKDEKKYTNFKLCWEHTDTQAENRGTKKTRLLSATPSEILQTVKNRLNWVKRSECNMCNTPRYAKLEERT
mgnify:CR=1 FL=1